MIKRIICSVFFLLFPALMMSCQSAEQNAVELKIDFKWNPPCTSLLTSPEITIATVPEGTVQFYVGLADLDLPGFNHGGGFISYKNKNSIAAGAVEGYIGPSPPYGIIHTYEIVVEALGPNEKVLGKGKSKHKFPPEGEEEKRWMPCN